jgi:hypothetical protein
MRREKKRSTSGGSNWNVCVLGRKRALLGEEQEMSG